MSARTTSKSPLPLWERVRVRAVPRLAVFSALLAGLLAACAPAASSPATGSAAGEGEDPAWQQIVSAAKQEGNLLIYGRILDGVEGTKYAEEFRKRYGITVDFINGAGGPMLERVRNETKAGQPSADIYQAAFPWPEVTRQEGVLMPLKAKPLPAFKEPKEVWSVEPWYLLESREYMADQFTALPGHVAVNPKVISPAAYPKSYQQLMTDPKFKGKISYVNPKLSGELATRWVTHGYIGGLWSLRDLWNLYTYQQPLLFANTTDSVAAVTRGDAAITLTAGTVPHLPAAESGLLKNLRFPELPQVYHPSALGVVKTAKHPNAALVFINWFYSKEGQDIYTGFTKGRSLRRDVPSKIPEAMNAPLVGGGNAGPDFVTTGLQLQLIGDLHAAKVMLPLPDGISYEDFERSYNSFIKEWEAKQGGPQKQRVALGN